MNDTINRGIISCDERLAEAQKTLDRIRTLHKEFIKTENIEVERIPSGTFDDDNIRIKDIENDIKLFKIEKMIYTALKNTKSVRAIYKKLQDKYAEAMVESIELSSQMVSLGVVGEGEHLDFCNRTKIQKKYIDRLCQYGENECDKKSEEEDEEEDDYTIITNWSIPSKPSVICFVKRGNYIYERVRTSEKPEGVINWTTSVAILLPGRPPIFSRLYSHYKELVIIH
jgi:hypothetical protein